MSKIIGRFFLKLTDSKNLIGEFSNNTDQKIYTEGAVLESRHPDDGKFIGNYFSTWYEGTNNCVLAKLNIKRKNETSENIFSLTWWNFQNDGQFSTNPSFWGEGILCDGILIGDYRNF
jgi:hypothetical protein